MHFENTVAERLADFGERKTELNRWNGMSTITSWQVCCPFSPETEAATAALANVAPSLDRNSCRLNTLVSNRTKTVRFPTLGLVKQWNPQIFRFPTSEISVKRKLMA